MLSCAIAVALFTNTRALPKKADDLPAVRQSGLHLTANGNPIQLRAVNLGGWFLEEIWMTPWLDSSSSEKKKEIPDSATLWRTVSKHLGEAAMTRVRRAWRQNWITRDDFARIKAAGFNSVRIPFKAEMLDEPDGLTWLHTAVDDATQAGLYSIIDMHGVRGGQSTDQPTGEVGRNHLWFDVENITKAEADWTLLAREFGKNPNVAMFDLMNEPMGAPNEGMLYLVYNRLYQAVRKAAPNTVVLIDDGYKGFKTTPHPNLASWTDVCFSLHFYDFDAKSGDDHLKSVKARLPEIKELLGYRNAPLFVGEWNVEPNGGPAVIRGVVDILDGAEFNWAFWTYKVMPTQGTLGDWGVYHPVGKVTALDPFHDDEATLLAKMKGIQTSNLGTSPGMLDAFRLK
jgi:hypothetical protein